MIFYQRYSLNFYSAVFFLTIFLGYRIQSTFIQFYYYVCRWREDPSSWKIQPTKGNLRGLFWGDPLFSSKPDRAPFHHFVTAFNLLMASTFAGLTCELAVTCSSFSKLRFDMPLVSGSTDIQLNGFMDFFEYSYQMACIDKVNLMRFYFQLLGELIGIIFWQSFLEYYWHRMMHLSFFYARFHKWHHYYKAPEPWDDLYIHPLEAFGYYCILYSPAAFFQIHVLTFIAYMLIMGLAGVADHSGVILKIPFIYNSMDHDNHHKHFNCNYAFPFPFMDIIGGTYHVSGK